MPLPTAIWNVLTAKHGRSPNLLPLFFLWQEKHEHTVEQDGHMLTSLCVFWMRSFFPLSTRILSILADVEFVALFLAV